MKTRGQQIRTMRQKRGLTQRALAALLGISPVTVSLWETGKSGVSDSKMAKIAHATSSSWTGPYDPSAPLSKRITYLRIQAGLSLKDLADCIGTHDVTISRWEQGKTAPSRRFLYRLSKYFNVNFPELDVRNKAVQKAHASYGCNLGSPVGLKISELRIKAGLSQRQLGKLIGVDDTTISAWELGKLDIKPKHEGLLCKLFQVTPDCLRARTEQALALWAKENETTILRALGMAGETGALMGFAEATSAFVVRVGG